MKTRDLITVCLQNLSRHKARTLLTVLGVSRELRCIFPPLSIIFPIPVSTG